MITLFKDMTPGQVIYALVKGDELKYCEGSIVSVGPQRVEMPQAQTGVQMPLQMPAMRNVVDVTYSLDGKNYTDAVEVTSSSFPTKNPGDVTLVATDREAVVKELYATLKTSENYLAEAEKNVPKQKERVKDCKKLIAQLDTAYMEKQQTEQRFNKIEEAQKKQGDKLDNIQDMLKELLKKS